MCRRRRRRPFLLPPSRPPWSSCLPRGGRILCSNLRRGGGGVRQRPPALIIYAFGDGSVKFGHRCKFEKIFDALWKSMSRQKLKGSLTLELPQASKVTTIFHFNASSPSTPLAPFPFSSPPLPLLLSNKSWAKHSLPPCDLHLKGKLRRGIRAMAVEGREPASCQRYVTNKFVIYVYIILHGVGLCVCVSSVLGA